MVNSNLQNEISSLDISKLNLGHIVVGIESINSKPIVVNDTNKFFLAKYGFYDIGVLRENISKKLDADKLLDGDIIEDLGLLRWPLKIISKHQLQILKSLEIKDLLVLNTPDSKNNTNTAKKHGEDVKDFSDDYYTVASVYNKKNPDIVKVNKKISVLLSELYQLQDNVAEEEKTQDQGFELLSDIFEQGNFQPIVVKGIEQLSKRIFVNGQINSKASHLLMLLKDHDDYTFRHSVDVANQLLFIMKYMGNYDSEALKDIVTGGLLHDIGKAKIPHEILNKPGKLSENEWKVMRLHPTYSGVIMQQMNLNKLQIEMGKFHHLRKNGSGYPADGLYDAQHEVVRMLMIIDVYQALVTVRPYKKADTPYAALSKINSLSGQLFDSWLVDIFIKAFGLYPIGSFIRLNDFRYGFVVSNDRNSLRPTVIVCFDKQKNRILHSDIIDLSSKENEILEVVSVVDHRDFFKKNEALDFFMHLSV